MKRYQGQNRRIGPKDRRVAQQAPQSRARKGWDIGPADVYKRVNPVTNKVTFERDGRIGPKDRRKH